MNAPYRRFFYVFGDLDEVEMMLLVLLYSKESGSAFFFVTFFSRMSFGCLITTNCSIQACKEAAAFERPSKNLAWPQQGRRQPLTMYCLMEASYWKAMHAHCTSLDFFLPLSPRAIIYYLTDHGSTRSRNLVELKQQPDFLSRSRTLEWFMRAVFLPAFPIVQSSSGVSSWSRYVLSWNTKDWIPMFLRTSNVYYNKWKLDLGCSVLLPLLKARPKVEHY